MPDDNQPEDLHGLPGPGSQKESIYEDPAADFDNTCIQQTSTNQASQQKVMEVHHHSHENHGKKNWKSYFREFLMLFLAVFCGFLAEYQLEHQIEKDGNYSSSNR